VAHSWPLAERAEREASEASTASGGTALANGLTVPQKRATTAAPNLPRPNPAAAAFRQNYRDEAKVRIEAALNAEIGFAERLTWFWSNHFCISVAKNGVRPLAGAYEREAIRPNVLGRFADMLLAAETHPAMLIYLARSIGPNSQAGRDRGKGLNENLAREILELHTLGVRTVYTQDDVTRFAKIITGWTVIPPREEHGGEFRFNPHMHEPGAQTLIGRPFADALVTIEPGGRIADDRNTGGDKAFAVGPIAPLVVRGPAPVLSWTPPRLEPATDDTLMRPLELYRHTDVSMAHALEERIGLAAIARAGGIDAMQKNAQPAGAAQVRAYFAESAGSAAKFMARPDGPRVGALAFDGWDTHANEGTVNGRLAALLGALDGAIAAVESGMGPAWRDTVVAVVTEFGRTARINGSDGTDHGTGTIALLAGGAVRGGRVIADWPGLKEADLHQKRDLKPTTDLHAVLKGVLRDHLRVSDAALAATVFPDSAPAKAISGLIATA
jgi:hypothetical protein